MTPGSIRPTGEFGVSRMSGGGGDCGPVLVLNSDSSSVKFDLIDPGAARNSARLIAAD